jgi:TonB-dependent receptor
MIRKSTFFSLLVRLLFIFLNTTHAQESGQIQGVVTDSTTGDGLTGANLFLKGTSLGVATDAKGNFKLTGIPPNTYTLIVRYIGYRQKNIPVTIVSGKTLELNIVLPNEIIEGTPVVVTAQAIGQRGAINEQINSNTIINVVSAEKIHQLPDDNAATALSRLPGISLMNGDQVVIRGIQAKQNLILVNGIQLPSTDINNRSTNLGFISSNMLSGIEVVKVVTPDMDANAIGGTVNLKLREAPENFHFDVLTSGNFNHQDRTWDNYKFWASASDRFFDNNLGIFIQANSNRLNGGNDQTSATYGISDDMPYGEATYAMNNFTFRDQVNIISSMGGSVIMDYRLPHGSILLQNTVSQGLYNMATFNNQFDFAGNRIVYSLNRDKNTKNLMVNALQTEYNIGDLKTSLTLSHSFSDKSTSVRFGDAGDNVNFQNTRDTIPWGYDYVNMKRIDYSAARYTLTPAQVLNIEINPDDYKGAIIQDWAVLRSQAFKEHIYNAKLDFTLPVAFSDIISSEFKLGGKFMRTTRTNDLNEWYKRTGDNDFYAAVRDFIPGKYLTNTSPLYFTDVQNTDYTRGQYFLNDTYDYKYAFNIDQMSDFYTLAKSGWGSAIHQAGSVQNDFNGAEIFSAAYFMGSFNIGPDLSIIGGARFEHYNMNYKATFFVVSHPVDGNGRLIDTLNTSNRSDDHLYPSIQARYKFTDWCDLRLAYTQTVSRADYQAILPNVFYSPGVGSQAGNPKLKPLISTNYDAYLSFYNNEIGLFTVGGFYKKMNDVFYSATIYFQNLSHYNASFPDTATWRALGITTLPNPSEQVSTYINNPAPAYVKGLELEWQTNFWYLPNPLNSLVMNINYTRVWSNMDYQQIRNKTESYIYIDPITGRRFTRFRYITTDTIRTARLINQGNDILNIALGVDYKGFSGRISFNMQGNVITSVGNRPETDQYTGNIYRWDFTLKQQLPIEGLSVSLSGVNIFHNAIKTYQKFRRISDGPIFDNELSTLYTPRIFALDLRYTL